jgi:hypothetical protein
MARAARLAAIEAGNDRGNGPVRGAVGGDGSSGSTTPLPSSPLGKKSDGHLDSCDSLSSLPDELEQDEDEDEDKDEDEGTDGGATSGRRSHVGPFSRLTDGWSQLSKAMLNR